MSATEAIDIFTLSNPLCDFFNINF